MPNNTTPHTNLDLEIQIPWLNTYELGQGIDALTGATKHKALQDFRTLHPTEGHRSTSGSHIIHNLHEQHRENKILSAATINVGSLAAPGVKFDYTNSKAFSSSSFMVEYWIDGQYDFERAAQRELKLTPTAKMYVRDPREFRKRYGDYFICGFQRRYSFRAIVNCKAKKFKGIRSVEAGAQLAVNSLFDVKGSARHDRLSVDKAVVESTLLSHSGCDSDAMMPPPLSLDTVENAAKIARRVQRSACRGVRQIALLMHYSCLQPSLPTKVQVPRDVFSKLHQMNNACMNLELSHLHPAVVRNRSISSDAITLFKKGRATFVHDPIARDRAARKLKKAAKLIDSSIQRFDLMKSIKGLLSENSPPPVGRTIRDRTGHARWIYGMIRSGKVDVAPKARAWRITLANGLEAWECLLTVKSKSKICTQTDEFCFISRATRICHDIGANQYSSDDQVTIIGFSLTCNNARNVPVEFTILRGGIMSSFLSINVNIPRGCEWHCRVFFVNGELS